MSDSFSYVVAGLGGGAVIAALALGLILCHRTSGVVNFGQAAMGAYVAFAYYEFRDQGDLVLPLVGTSARIHLLTYPTQLSALVFAVVLSAVLGAVTYWVVFRPLRGAPPLAGVIASLGILLYFQEAVRRGFPVTGAAANRRWAVLPDGPVELLGAVTTVNRLILAGLAVAVTAVLWAVFRSTRFGLATRAAASNEKGALLAGVRPDRVAVVNWMIATTVTGMAVILIEPIAGLDPVTTSLLVVPALGAALLGGLRSFWITLLAGLGTGALQSLILGVAVEQADAVPDWLPTPGLQQAVPVVLILAALMWRGDALPGRAAVLERRLPTAPSPRRPALWAAVGAAAVAVGLLTFDALGRQGLVTSMIYALLALSVVVVTGFVGQISLVQLSFAGLAGFTLIVCAEDGMPFPLAAVVACAVATAVGVLVGLPATRVRGMSLGVATLAVAVAIEQLVLASTSFTGGALGRRAPRPSLFGLDIGYFAPGADNFRPAMGFVVLAALVACCLGVANLRRNQTGLRWLAVRSNERAAAAVGIDVARAKLGAFAVSSFLAGLCGVFTAVTTTTLSMTSFPVIGSLVVVALVYLGGISSIGGALVAGLLAQGGLLGVLVSGSEAGDGSSVQAMSGVLLIAVAILTPDGLTGLARRAGRALQGRATLGPVLRTRFWALDMSSGRDIQCPERSSRSTPDGSVDGDGSAAAQVGAAP